MNNIVKKLLLGLGIGMKKTEEKFFHQSGINETLGTTINQQVEDHRVSKDLLKGEVTQEVKDLRYRTYKIDRESREINMISPLVAFKKDNDFFEDEAKRVKYENSENAKIILVQPNFYKGCGLNESMNGIDLSNEIKDENGHITYKVNEIKDNKDKLIIFNRSCTPRYEIEKFVTKLVLKENNDDNYIIDLYVSKYPDGDHITSAAFLKEIISIMNNEYKSDTTDIDEIEFTTMHAYLAKDMYHFHFNKLSFIKIVEYDGSYVLKYSANAVDKGSDLTEKYYSERIAKKYEENAPRSTVIDIDLNSQIREYTCACCGKKVTYNPNVSSDNELEFMDLEMTEQTFGKFICKECLEKNMEELYKNHNGKTNQFC